MSTPEAVVCASCDRAIAVCCFCDEHCGHELCYQCVIFGLHESIAQPHVHGG